MSGNPTSRDLTRNRRVGERKRGPHESFSLVSSYSAQYPSLGEIPPHNGKRNPVHGRERNSEPALLLRRRLTYMTQRSGCLYCGSSRYCITGPREAVRAAIVSEARRKQ